MHLSRLKTILNYLLLFTTFVVLFLFLKYTNGDKNKNIDSKYRLTFLDTYNFGYKTWLWFGDLDGNGNDEFIAYGERRSGSPGIRVNIYERYNEAPIKKCVFPHKFVRYIQPMDINGDRAKEILVPYYTQDSLKLRILDFAGNEIQDLSLLPVKNLGSHTIFFKPIGISHSDSDTFLIYRIHSNRPTYPVRGIYMSNLQGEKIWEVPFDSYLAKTFVNDVNGDGNNEIVCLSNYCRDETGIQSAYKNSHAYLVVFDLNGQEIWHRKYSGSYTQLNALVSDFERDVPGDEILLSVTNKNELNKYGNEILVLSGNNKTLYQKKFLNRIWQLFPFDLDSDQQDEVFIVFDDYVVQVRDRNLEFILSREVPITSGKQRIKFAVQKIVSDEPSVVVATGIWLNVLDFNLNSIFSKRVGDEIYFYQDKKDEPLLMPIYSTHSRRLNFTQLQKNPYYYYFRLFFVAAGFLCCLLLVRVPLFFTGREKPFTLERLLRLAISKDFDLGIGVFDKKGILLSVNPKMQEIYNRNFNSLLGKHYDEIFSILNPPMKKLLDEIYQGRFSEMIREIPHWHDEKEREIKVILRKIDNYYDPYLTSEYVLWIAEDITELVQSKRLGAWLSMAQRYAHDIKTPLSTVHLTIQRTEMEMEKNQIKDADKYYYYLNYVKEEIARIRQITNSFLKFVRAEELNKMPTDFDQLMSRMIDIYKQRLPEGITLSHNNNDKIGSVLLDEEQIQVVLENILDNAINAIDGQGEISITTDLIEEFNNNGDSTNRQVLIEISDTGVGISEENLKEVFQPYYSASSNGTGLGLMFVKRIIEDHKGTILIRSQENIGTVIIIKIPV